MNHDATHCSDYKKSCPKKCYRAQLTEEYRSRKHELYWLPISWSHFEGTKECPKRNELSEDNNDGV